MRAGFPSLSPCPGRHCLSLPPLLFHPSLSCPSWLGSLGSDNLIILSCSDSLSSSKTSEILQCHKAWKLLTADVTQGARGRSLHLPPPRSLSHPSRPFFFLSFWLFVLVVLVWFFFLPSFFCHIIFLLWSFPFSESPQARTVFASSRWQRGAVLPTHGEVSPSQHRVNEGGDRWHVSGFPGDYWKVTSSHLSEDGIYILLDQDILLNFLRALVDALVWGFRLYLTESCLAEEKMSWLGKWRLTQPVEKDPSAQERQGNNLASALR